MSASTPSIIAGLAFIAAAGVFYALADKNATTSIVFALILLAGFGFIARAFLQR